jgi:CDP-paratose 2-epimerase
MLPRILAAVCADSRPFDDFEVEALGIQDLIESTRLHSPKAAFAQMSTNKVYGDRPKIIRR